MRITSKLYILLSNAFALSKRMNLVVHFILQMHCKLLRTLNKSNKENSKTTICRLFTIKITVHLLLQSDNTSYDHQFVCAVPKMII